MRHVGGEVALGAEARLETVERPVDGVDQRHDLSRHALLGQAHVGARRADGGRRGRCLAHRIEGAAEDQDVDQQQHQDRKGDPGDAREERGHDVVDDDVAMRQVLPDLDPVHAIADRARDAHAKQHRAGAAPAHEPVAHRLLVLGEQRAVVGTRREDHVARRVEHGVGVETVATGIERLDLGRDIERHAAIGLRPQEARDAGGMAAQGVAMKIVRRLVEQPVESEWHQERRDADRHDVQRHDARDDRAEADRTNANHATLSSAIRYLTVLTAELTYQTALVNLVQAQANRFADTAALFQALGGGWWNRADVDPKSEGRPAVFWLPPVQDIRLPAAGR